MDTIRARVITQEKGLYKILYENQERWAEVSGKFRHEAVTVSDFPGVGDYVLATWPTDGSNAVITDLFPRKSVFMRKAAGTGKQEQVVAANIDTIFVCMSLNRDFNIRRVERYLSVAWDSGATPVVVLTKADLCDNPAEKIREVEEIAVGVDILAVSSYHQQIDGVTQYLQPGKTIAFLGSSGVGKSTLINGLLGKEQLATAGIRDDDDKGRHTTTRRELLVLENGAFVIDTPGMRELGMWDNTTGIDTVFADIEALMTQCKFSDCSHTNEPGCRVLQALKEGELDPDRWASYLKLKTENLYSADAGAYLQAKKEKFKTIAKMIKKSHR